MLSRNHRAGTIGLSITSTITGTGTARYGHGQAEGLEPSDADEGLAGRG